MPPARIDQAAVAQMIAVRLETITGLRVVHQRDPEPEGTPAEPAAPESPEDAWVRVLPLRLMRRRRQRNGTEEPDLAEVEVELIVMVGPRYASQFAGDAAVQRVVDALDEATLTEKDYDESGERSHLVAFSRAQCEGLIVEDEENAMQALLVTVRGSVRRLHGATTRNFMEPRG